MGSPDYDYDGRLARHPISGAWLTKEERLALMPRPGDLLTQEELRDALKVVFSGIDVSCYGDKE